MWYVLFQAYISVSHYGVRPLHIFLRSPITLRQSHLAGRRDVVSGSGLPKSPFHLQYVCKRAAEKLNIPWTTVVAETAKSRYEGKRLSRAKWAAQQLLSVFQELLEELAVTWKDKPFTSKLPMQRGSALDVEGMEKAGLLRMPPMKPLVAAHVHPKNTAAANPTLPSKADYFQSSMTERAYKAIALSVRALNETSMLTAYQAELQDEVSTMPGQTHWEDICVITDLSLCLRRCAVQTAGKAMATMVIQERGRWLSLANLSDREKDAPVVAEGIFASALTLMQKRYEEKKRDDKALQLCMPRKAQTAPPPSPWQTFTQVLARTPPSYRIPRWQKLNVNEAVYSGVPEQRTAWPRKNYPPATAQAVQPASQPHPHSHAQGAARKKAVWWCLPRGKEHTRPLFASSWSSDVQHSTRDAFWSSRMLCGKIEPAWASEKYERWCSGVHPPTSHKHFSCSKLNTIFSVFPEHVAKHNRPPNFAKHGNRPQYNITSGSYCSLRGDKTLKLCPSAKCPRMRCTDNKLVHDSATRWHQNPANKQLAEQFGYRLQFAASQLPPPPCISKG